MKVGMTDTEKDVILVKMCARYVKDRTDIFLQEGKLGSSDVFVCRMDSS